MPEHVVYRCDRMVAVDLKLWMCVVVNKMFSLHYEDSFYKLATFLIQNLEKLSPSLGQSQMRFFNGGFSCTLNT